MLSLARASQRSETQRKRLTKSILGEEDMHE
jgi:hypothetical protein